MAEVLRMENITKIYSNGFMANRDVNLVINEGEIHALVGENGAGKTTLMKILFGMENFQGGRILLDGKDANISSPLDAIAKGIGMVHQHFMQVPSLSVAENVTLGMEPAHGLVFDKKEAARITQDISDKYQLKVDANERIADMGVGLRQKVEILKALVRKCRILILDEPTAVLTPQETQELFVQLKAMKQDGIAVIFISHKLEEVMSLCDRVTVLRHGHTVGSDVITALNPAKISRMMVGRDVVLEIQKEPPVPKENILKVEDLYYENAEGVMVVNGVSFGIRSGEIVGIAGVEGNGQNQVAELIAGMIHPLSGTISICGKKSNGKSVRKIREMGLAYISEDRMVYGCAPNLPIRENIMADRVYTKQFRKFGVFLDTKKINQTIDGLIQEFEIACDDRGQPVRMLSGGNIQKVIVAREFTSGAKLILANQPTRGIDVGTTEMIRKTLVRKSRHDGVATLLVSSDLNEILEVSDRLLVMKGGKIVAHFPVAGKVTADELGEYMLGVRRMEPEEMGDLL